jgi:hypothetical protein
VHEEARNKTLGVRMGAIASWLLHEDRKDLFEVLFALVLNILFLALISLLLWPLSLLRLAWDLAKDYGVLWIVIVVTTALVNRLQRLFRTNLYDRSNAYVISNLAVSCLLQVGWSAFAALTVHRFVDGVPVWTAIALYLVGALSCLITFFAVSSLYQGTIYKLVSLPLALVSFLVFSVWPASLSRLRP